MTAFRWQQIERLYHAVLEYDPAGRAEFLAKACRGDANLRDEVESLLAADSSKSATLDRPAWEGTAEFTPPESSAFLLAEGTQIGSYKIEAPIGSGGMGSVYRATDTRLKRPVAIKFLFDILALAADATQREAQLASSLNHPHIITVYDVGEFRGCQYLVTEFMDCGTLKDWAKTQERTWQQAVEILAGVAEGLAAAHEARILHRDIKPANILVAKNGYAKLADFGLAKMADGLGIHVAGNPLQTHERAVAGTINYMSPEQALGESLDARSDIFSFGLVLYEMVTRRQPFRGVTDLESLENIIHNAPPPLGAGYPAGLRSAVEKALAKDPAERYQSMRELVLDLRRLLRPEIVETPVGVPWRSWPAWAAVVALGAGLSLWEMMHRAPSPENPLAGAVGQLKPQRLTANTPELTIQAAAISPDGKFIAYSDQLGIHVRSTARGETRLLPGTEDHKFVRWLPDGNSVRTQVQSAVGEPTTTDISLRNGLPTPVPLADLFVASPDGTHRASVSADSSHISIQSEKGTNARELWRAAAKSTLDQFEWNLDSTKIGILSSEKHENGSLGPSALELIEIANSGRKKVLVAAEKNLHIGAMAWSRPNRLIVAINEETGFKQYQSNLWEIRLNAGEQVVSELRKLTAWTDFPIRPGSLSAYGKRLVFIRSFRQRDVYVAPLGSDGTRIGTPRRLTLDLGDDYPSDWTRDSKTVIFTSTRNGPQTIFRQDLDKMAAEQVVRLPGHQVLARVTPDGNSLLFMSMDAAKTPDSQKLMHAPIRGGAAEPVPNAASPGFYYRCAPAAGVCLNATPERNKEGDNEFVISTLDVAKGKGREIYRDRRMEHPDISPDGKWIADTSESRSGAKIIIRSFATGEVVRETAIPGSTKLMTFGYAPDGNGFFASDIRPTEVRELYVDASGKTSVLYREPASVGIIWGIPSPDGKYLALVLVTDDSNIYTVENF